MIRKTHPPVGFRFTLRHHLIAVAYFAVLSAGMVSAFEGPAATTGCALARWVLLATPWVLGSLVWVFDRPGPLRDWTSAGLLFAFYPALTIYIDLSIALDAASSRLLPSLGPILLFNALMLVSSLAFYRKMKRLNCPVCARRSLIPLIRLKGQSRRSDRTRWCASCGGQFWRDSTEAWRVERRRTWIDHPPSVLGSAGEEMDEDPVENGVGCQSGTVYSGSGPLGTRLESGLREEMTHAAPVERSP